MIRKRIKESIYNDIEDFWRICSMLDWDYENGYKALDKLLEDGYINKKEYEDTKEQFDSIIEDIEEEKQESKEYYENDDNYDSEDWEIYYKDDGGDLNLADYILSNNPGEDFEILRDVHKVLNDIVENGFEVVKASEEDGYASVAIMPNSDTYKSITNKPIWIYSPMNNYEEEGFLWDWDENIFYMSNSLDRFFYELQHSPEIDKFWATIDYDQDKILEKLGR